jgi:hypothetical protein
VGLLASSILSFDFSPIQGQTDPNLRVLKVNFDSIQFNYDHDSTRGRGEIFLVASVNEQKVQLIQGQNIMESEQIRFEDLDNESNALEHEVIVAIPKDSKLNISLEGYEQDGIDNVPIPMIGTLLSIGDLFDFDDKIGIVNEQYDMNDNYGLGEHRVISQYDGTSENTINDYVIHYTITEL